LRGADLTSSNRVVGTTSFPCMLYNISDHKVKPISNFMTAVRAADRLEKDLGLEITQVNTPGNNHSTTMETVAENGGTHAEPGSGCSAATRPTHSTRNRSSQRSST
jgi:predicted amino acid racemase